MFSRFLEGKNKFSNLRKLNVAAGFLHLVQGVIMFSISNKTTLTLTTSFLKTSANSDLKEFEIVPNLMSFAEWKLGYAIAAFLFMSAAAHFLVAFVFYDWYKKSLEKGTNFARWIEYSFSASWMIMIIGALVGILDVPSLILLFTVNASMILFGWMMEKHNQLTKKTDWTAFIFGCIVGLVPWLIIAWYFISAIKGYTPGADGNPIPDFVYVILISLFLFFNIFAVNMYLQYKKVGPWKNYLFGELVYIILSLLAKSLLAWQVWSGTLRG